MGEPYDPTRRHCCSDEDQLRIALATLRPSTVVCLPRRTVVRGFMKSPEDQVMQRLKEAQVRLEAARLEWNTHRD